MIQQIHANYPCLSIPWYWGFGASSLPAIEHQLKVGHKVQMIVYDHDRRWVPKFEELGIKVHTSYLKKPGIDLGPLPVIEKLTYDSDIVHPHDLNPAIYRLRTCFYQSYLQDC